MKRYYARPKRDYSDLIPQVVELYAEMHNTNDVARALHIGSAAVCRLLKEAGVDTRTKGKGRYMKSQPHDGTCGSCRHGSSVTGGVYCLLHHRTERKTAMHACYAR